MDDSRNPQEYEKPSANDEQFEEEVDRSAGDYYYDDSTGYQIYDEADDDGLSSGEHGD
jgi:hypothetical protein